jgi:hypothetical protein
MCRVPLYGWVGLGFSAWCALSVPAGISAGRWFRRRRAADFCSREHQHVVRRSTERLLTAAQEEAKPVFVRASRDEVATWPGDEDEPMAAEAARAGQNPTSSHSSGARRLPN